MAPKEAPVADDDVCKTSNMSIFYIVMVAGLVCGALVLLVLSITYYNREADEPPTPGKVSKGDILALSALGVLIIMFVFISLVGGNTAARGPCSSIFMTLFYTTFTVGIVGISVICMTYGIVFMRDSDNRRRQDRGQMLLTVSLVLVIMLIAVVAYQASFKDLLQGAPPRA
jgi:heme/copper-type cytochrome/quinol oxidase subunit 2